MDFSSVNRAAASVTRPLPDSVQAARQASEALLAETVTGAAKPTSRGRQRRHTQTPAADTPAALLAEALDTGFQPVVLRIGRVDLHLDACVHLDTEHHTVALLFWNSGGFDLQIRDDSGEVHQLTLQASGETFDIVYLGARTKIGLCGVLIAFMLIASDEPDEARPDAT